MPLAAAIAGAAVIGGGASIIAAGKASSAAKHAADENNQLQTDIYNKNATTLAPYVRAGIKPTASISALLGQDGSGAANDAFNAFTNSDGYQFRVNQGEKAVEAALGARGYTDSGAERKALLSYGQGEASDEFGKYLGYLTGQQGVGLTAASAQAGVGQNFANSVSANNNNAANNTGNAYLSGANSINGILGSSLSAYGLSQGLKSSYGAPANTNAGTAGWTLDPEPSQYLTGTF
jgi:hypothetical protein